MFLKSRREKSFVNLQYVTHRKEEWNIKDWPKDLIDSYEPEQMVLLMISRKGKLTTMFFKVDDARYNPKSLYELSQDSEKSLVIVPL